MAKLTAEILRIIAEGRETTEEIANGAPAEAGTLAPLGRDLRDFHKQLQNADLSKPGAIARLLGGGHG